MSGGGGFLLATAPPPAAVPAPVTSRYSVRFLQQRFLFIPWETPKEFESINTPKHTENLLSAALAGFTSCPIKQPPFYLLPFTKHMHTHNKDPCIWMELISRSHF